MKEGRQSYRRAHKVAIAERRARVAQMYLAGRTQLQIACELGLSTFTVSTDIGAMVAEWRRMAAVDTAAHIAVELERIREVEVQAWESFRKSRQPKEIRSAGKRSETNGDGSSSTAVTVTTIHRPEGSPQFLSTVLRCIEQRVKLLGLDFHERLQEGRQTQPATLEEFVVAHSKPDQNNNNGSTPKAARPATVQLDPNRLP